MEAAMGGLAILFLVLAYFLYRPRNLLGKSKAGTPWQRLEEIFFSAFYLDRFYQLYLVGPYQKISRFLWVKVDEDVVDSGLAQTAGLLPVFSLSFRLWATGKLSTYLKMLFLGFTAILAAIVLGWYPW